MHSDNPPGNGLGQRRVLRQVGWHVAALHVLHDDGQVVRRQEHLLQLHDVGVRMAPAGSAGRQLRDMPC